MSGEHNTAGPELPDSLTITTEMSIGPPMRPITGMRRGTRRYISEPSSSALMPGMRRCPSRNVAEAGIVQRGEVVTWAGPAADAEGAPAAFGDLTGWECFGRVPITEVSQQAGLSSAGQDADGRFGRKMPFRSYSG